MGVAASAAALAVALVLWTAREEPRAQAAAAGSLRELAPPPPLPRPRPAAAVRIRSARPQDLPRRRVRRPVALRVPAIGLRARVVPVGVRGRHRVMELPARGDRVGWYRHGAHPGAPGVAVLAAHADWAGRPAAFLRAAELAPGDRVRVAFRRGAPRTFRVIARRSYPKRRLPARLFARGGRPALALVTCGGAFDAARRTYARNTVVWAVAASY